METLEMLIMIRNSDTNQFEDKTSEVATHKWIENKSKIEIRYSKSNQSYTFNSRRVKLLELKGIVDTTGSTVLEGDIPLENVKEVLDFGQYVKVIKTTGKTQVFEKKALRLEKLMPETEATKRVKQHFKNLFNLSSTVLKENLHNGSVVSEEDGKKSFLDLQFNKIVGISERSVLGHYLSRTPPEKFMDKMPLIFPFGFNVSQKQAVINGLNHQISIVQGPPGTGKTQTILNLLANLILREKHVAVVSNNNSPVENVIEKFEKYGYGYLIAQLGSSDNQDVFFRKTEISIPNLKDAVLTNEVRKAIEANLKALMGQIETLLDKQTALSNAKEKLIKYKTEQAHFEASYSEAYVNPSEVSVRKKWSKNKLFELIQALENVSSLETRLPVTQKIKLFMSFGIYDFKTVESKLLPIIKASNRMFYELSVAQLNSEIVKYEQAIKNGDLSKLMSKYTELSKKLFEDALGRMKLEKYNHCFTKKDYKKQYNAFKKRYPIVTSTTHSLLQSCPNQYKFDWVITDESSQVDILTGYLTMSAANNLVVVGDPQQLNQIPEKQLAVKNDEICFDIGLEEAYNYSRMNLITSIMNVFGSEIPMTLLTEHYRCHPQIIRYCNEKYYANALVIMTEGRYDDKVLKLIKTAPGNHARASGNTWFNTRQAEIIRDEVLGSEPERYSNGEQIGIIAPYRNQVDEIVMCIKNKSIAVDSVHKFQGREKDTIIFSTTVNELNDFVDKADMINVAVSRAVKELIVICPSHGFRTHGSHIGDLIRYMTYNTPCSEVINSSKISVFDLLYNEYAAHLATYKSKVRKVTDVLSENLLFVVIEELLEEEQFTSFKCVPHTPLHSIVGNYALLTDEEARFARYPKTHVDFLFYNRHDKEPVLAVEVDGYAFHRNSPEQLERDKKKNAIMRKIDLPLLRLATYESGERERLREALESVLHSNYSN